MTVLMLVGTRPEAIKLAPVALELRARGVPHRLASTGQHDRLLAGMLSEFGLDAPPALTTPAPGRNLNELLADLVGALDRELQRDPPTWVVAQGDTTSVLAAGLASAHLKVPFAHVEAGLRSGDRDRPFPEELNRRMASVVAAAHFAPTAAAADNLLREGVEPDRIVTSGNTVIDAVRIIVESLPPASNAERPQVLVTCHRRENLPDGIANVCRAAAVLADDGAEVTLPVHANPEVASIVHAELDGRDRIHLIDPLPYPAMLAHIRDADLVLTDSGGLQEECAALGTPAVVARTETERPEALECGWIQLGGTDVEVLVDASRRLLDGPPRPDGFPASDVFGNGFASRAIVDHLVGDGGSRL